jgi:UTP--glucose-1-phosphate uridylyltransferase
VKRHHLKRWNNRRTFFFVNITKAVITMAAPNQRTLALQTLVDRDGQQKSVLNIIIEEARRAGIAQICVVVCPGDESAYRQVAGEGGDSLSFVPQAEPLGYGHAVFCARDFVGGEPFLHMIGDHVYLSAAPTSCSQQIVEAARANGCAVSGVQPTRENLLPYFGTVGGYRIKGSKNLYGVEQVVEKPTPTQAEQSLLVPGLRTGHYLCFFGMHVLTPTVINILEEHVREHLARRDASTSSGASPGGTSPGGVQLSPVLAELAGREKYLALEAQGRRYPLDARYGLLTAQLALGLSGRDRDEVLAGLCEMLAQRGPNMHEAPEDAA